MIGDVIGKPGREAIERILPELRAADGHRLRHRQRREPGRRHGPDHRRPRPSLFAAGVDVDHVGQPHLGQARDLPVPRDATSGSCGPLNYGTDGVPGRGWGVYRGGRRDGGRGHQPPGPDLHEPDREPLHRRRSRCSTRAPTPLPPVRLVDFHCEITSEKNAFGLHLDGRVSAVVGTHTHVPTARRADPARRARPTRATSG